MRSLCRRYDFIIAFAIGVQSVDWDWVTTTAADAVVATVIGGIFSGCAWATARLLQWALSRRPLYLLLATFRDNNTKCLVFVRPMECKGGELVSKVPDVFPPYTSNRVEKWQNIPRLVSTSCMSAAKDILVLLGQVGKVRNIDFATPELDWDKWTFPMVLCGGSSKTREVLASHATPPVELEGDGFRVASTNLHYRAVNNQDFGLVWMTSYPPTGKRCLVVFGLGCLGTEAAGYFVRQNAGFLGSAFAGRDFAVLVRARLSQGRESASAIWMTPPRRSFRWLHPFQWKRFIYPLTGELTAKHTSEVDDAVQKTIHERGLPLSSTSTESRSSSI